ncbi:MAG: hypothetical protein ACR2HH_15715 [Chthoniobacterales bacterium]
MKKNSRSNFGLFNPRVVLAVALCSIGASLAFLSLASTPSSGTLTDLSGPLNYSAGPFNQPNQSPLGAGQLDTGPRCNGQFPCDNFALTVNVPAAYLTAHPNASAKVTMFWTDTGSGQSDYDLYIYKGVVGNLNGSMPADYQSASGNNPEIAVISPLTAGAQQYTIKIVPFQPTQEIVNVRIELQAGTVSGGGGGGGGPFGGADPTVPGNPRYQNFYPPAGSSADQQTQGEFNIGVNNLTGHIFAMNSGPIWRLTPGEIQTPVKPECCEALWEDKTAAQTSTGLDPILFTDRVSGRTFASNSTAGALASAYTDSVTPGLNDGDQYLTPVAPPNGGADHQTIGSGPYPAALDPVLGNAVNQHQAVYYCSQDVVGPAACQRTDDLGVHWSTVGGLPYDGTTGPGCGGLHGHLHVAPNGTAWLPVNQCNGKQGGALSTSAAMPSVAAPTGWTQFVVQGNNDVNGGAPFVASSQTNGADPSVGIDSDSTAYYCYVNNQAGSTEGHVHVAVSTDNGATWIRDVDLGASHGIVNAALTEAVGGSSGRAACGFVGTNVPGNYQSGTFTGVWYPFISTTYDQGRTWTTVNAAPNDPVQSMIGIWQQGGSGQNGDRNLLDFNEITIDAKGRVLYGYDDGCTSPACIAGTAGSNLGASMRVARQFGGKTLFGPPFAVDPIEPAAPKPPCLAGTRDTAASHLTWKAPDNGGADIAGYVILRSTTAGTEAVIVANTANTKTTYNDTTADPAVPHYFYTVKAINAQGTGIASNEIDLVATALPPVESLCLLPGLTKLTDPSGDSIGGPGTDLMSFQIAQPYQGDGVTRLVFTINTDNGVSPQPLDSSWYVSIKLPGNDPAPAPQTGFHYRAVHMTWNGPTPTFESYTPSASNSGAVDGRFVTAGSQKPAEPSSSYNSPFNKVVIVVKANDLGLAPGSTIAGFVSGVAQSGVVVGALYDQMPDSLAYTSTYTVAPNDTCSPVLSVVSRKTHGPAGDFDIDLPFAGNAGIECRRNASNTHLLIYTFDRNVTVPVAASATVSPSGSATVAAGPNANQVSVTVSGAPNAQHVVVTLNGVQDAAAPTTVLNNLAGRLDVLLGDTSADGSVSGADVTQTKAQAGNLTNAGNFREDVTLDGSISGADVTVVKRNGGQQLPP